MSRSQLARRRVGRTFSALHLEAIEREKGRAVVPRWPWAPLTRVLRLLPPKCTKRFA